MLNLRNYDISFVELQQLTGLSRPTLYKYIELYNENRLISVRNDCIKLFDFISKNPSIDKSDIFLFYKTNCVGQNSKVQYLSKNILDNCTKSEIREIINILEKEI